MITVKYLKTIKMWHATYVDERGELGFGFTAKTREDAIFALGWQMSRRPDRYTGPLDDYLSQAKKS